MQEENKLQDSKKTFLYQSISNNQEIIRGIDAKLIGILVLLVIPIANIGKISYYIEKLLITHNKWLLVLYVMLTLVFIVCWAISFIVAVRGISSIDDPSAHIKVPPNVKGNYYMGGLYSLGFLDAFLNRQGIMSKQTLVETVDLLPESESAVILELTFDQMKIAYIRDVKIKRQKIAFLFLHIWLISGFFLWVLSYFGGK